MLKNVLISDLKNCISPLKAEMERKEYSQYIITCYSKIWCELVDYYISNNIKSYNQKTNQEFVDTHYPKALINEETMYNVTRAMQVLYEYVNFGVIFRCNSTTSSEYSKGFEDIFSEFMTEEKKRGTTQRTISAYKPKLLRLQDFLMDKGVMSLRDVSVDLINLYLLSFAGFSSSYISHSVTILKRLFTFTTKTGYLTTISPNMFPPVKNNRQQKIPSTFTREEIESIIKSTDTNNPIGKRNYAILLLASRLGMRSSDIMGLSFSNIDWANKKITFLQEKTKKRLTLPLFDDVGWAIIDYLKNGRPITQDTHIFVSHKEPYTKLAGLSNIIANQMRKANIKTPHDKRVGMHAFRHSLATQMLEENVPIPIISQTLGHSDITSTEVYLRVSITQLSKCGLEVDL